MKKFYSSNNIPKNPNKDVSFSRGNTRNRNHLHGNVMNQCKDEITDSSIAKPLSKTFSRGHARNLRDLHQTKVVQENQNGKSDTDYFKSYDRVSIHREMLQDYVRTLTYKSAICENKHLFRGKIVLDVGCGTGILSLFAAKAGAALVIGVDISSIIDITQEVVLNQPPEISNSIILIKSKIEDIVDLPRGIKKVDIIISEWMGYCLLFESMLDTVLYARNKWLKSDGLMFPDKVSLYIAGLSARRERDIRYNFWQDVYGFRFSEMRKWIDRLAVVEIADAQNRRTDDCLLKDFDLYTVQKEDLKFTVPFCLTATLEHEIQAFVTFFTVEFTHCHTPTMFSTSMDERQTHWKQTIFFLENDILLKKNEKIEGMFSLRQNPKDKRALDFAIKINFEGYYMNFKEKLFFVLR